MPSNTKASRRDPEDIKRDEQVYWYLLRLSGFKVDPKKPEIKQIALIWGFKGDRSGEKFIERVLSSLYDENSGVTLPSLSLSRLVTILQGIDSYLKNQDNLGKISRFLQDNDKIRAIRKYCELSRQEKRDLGLPIDFDSYIKENFIESSENQEISLHLSEKIPEGKYISEEDEGKNSELICNILKLKYVNGLIEEIIKEQLSEDWLNNNSDIVQDIQDKVKEQITLIAVESGLEIIGYNVPKIPLIEQCSQDFKRACIRQWEYQLADETIKKLITNIIENVRVSNIDQFSIHLLHLEIKKIGPLPFENQDGLGLINDNLLKHDPDKIATEEVFNMFKKNNTYQVKIEFRIRIKKDKDSEEIINFCEEISGISSILSLIRKALNRGLLWDIPCLKEYFPIMQEVYVKDRVLEGGDGLATISCISRGRLIKLKDLEKVLTIVKDGQNKTNQCSLEYSFNSYIEGSDITESQFIGFDLIEAIARSGFYARLKLIEESGIDLKTYLKQLSHRVKEKQYLEQGKKYLHSYPFSLLAMEKYLEKNILDAYENELKWSKLAYEAQLVIIRAYLTEGLTKKANLLLDKLENYFDNFSHFLKASYYLCQAEYSFLSDDTKSGKTKHQLIEDCQTYLQKAEEELRQILLKFFRIGESSQGNLSPLYFYWTKIYLLKARLSLFFPSILAKPEPINELFPSLVCFEKARVYYAPIDGNFYLCGKVSLYQSICYIMQGYIGLEPQGFQKEECIKWAEKLINHALLCYQEASQEAYQDYTDSLFSYNSDADQNKYPNLIIERPPFLNRVSSDTYNDYNNSNENSITVFSIDSKLIKRNFINQDQSSQVINLLFGHYSSLYFLALGMFTLCKDSSEDKIIDNIKEAYHYFVCSWAISEGGAKLKLNPDSDKYNLTRKSKPLTINYNNQKIDIEDKFNVSKLRGLFFHRVSEWMDLGKIFMAVSLCILAEDYTFSNWKLTVKAILGEEEAILSKVPEDFESFAAGQTDYNLHLKSQFKRIKDYLQDYMNNFENRHKKKPIRQRRDEIVQRIFRMLRGD